LTPSTDTNSVNRGTPALDGHALLTPIRPNGSTRAAAAGIAFLFLAPVPATSNGPSMVRPEVRHIRATTSPSALPILPGAAPRPTPPESRQASQVVRDLHESSGLTWDQLAKLFGVSRRAVHHWANGGNLTVRNWDILNELSRLVRSIPGDDPASRRAYLLSPKDNGYSMFESLRDRYSPETPVVSSPPFRPDELIGVLHDEE
jgi:hypothetical protein